MVASKFATLASSHVYQSGASRIGSNFIGWGVVFSTFIGWPLVVKAAKTNSAAK